MDDWIKNMRNRLKGCFKLNRVMVSDYTLEQYIDYLKRVEGYANKVGEKFYPYDSPEGGLKTIGYGYKLKTLEEQNTYEKTGLSEREVQDLLRHEAQLSFIKAKNFCISRNRKWSDVDDRLKYALADYCFNLGGLEKFPTTAKFLMHNNVDGVLEDDPGRPGFKQYERVFRDPEGKRRRLGRNKEFYKEFLQPYMEQA